MSAGSCDGRKAGPARAPGSCCLLASPAGGGSGLGEGQLANQGDRLGGPPATDFKAKDGKAAPRGVVEFRVGLGAFASRGFLDGGAGVGVGPPAGQSISSNGAGQGRVHCHLGSMPQGQAVHQDFDRPRVLRGVGKVHLVEGDVGVHSAAGFAAYASDRAFKGQGAGAQEASGGACTAVVTKLIQGAPAPASRVCEREGEAHTAPQENAEVFTGEGDLKACRVYGEGSARVGPGLGQQKCARRGVKVRKKRGGRIAVGC